MSWKEPEQKFDQPPVDYTILGPYPCSAQVPLVMALELLKTGSVDDLAFSDEAEVEDCESCFSCARRRLLQSLMTSLS